MADDNTNNNKEVCTLCPNECARDALQCGKGRRFFSGEEHLENGGVGHGRPEGENPDLAHLFMKCAYILKLKTGKSRGDGPHRHKGKHHHGHHQNYGHGHDHDLDHGINYNHGHHNKHEHKCRLSEEELFDMLSNEERESLQKLLIKVVSHWSQEYHNQEGRHKSAPTSSLRFGRC
ncbi:MAG TPA: hypothetical protein IAC62_07765 [Candidatus Pelethocola excrementipullorum]|nr:hypothetical protein [Candidatus Pelethocola excrementipullorum]